MTSTTVHIEPVPTWWSIFYSNCLFKKRNRIIFNAILRFFSTISIAQIFPVFKVYAEICIFLRFIGVKKQIKNTILYMRPVQERQQSLSLMEKLNSEKRTREQLQEDVAKLQVSFTVNLQFVLKLDTKKQKMFLFLISK